jgi:hypothetical protein
VRSRIASVADAEIPPRAADAPFPCLSRALQVGGGAFLPLGAGEFRAGEMAQHHAFLSRLLLLLGSFIILCLLLF